MPTQASEKGNRNEPSTTLPLHGEFCCYLEHLALPPVDIDTAETRRRHQQKEPITWPPGSSPDAPLDWVAP
jgi:hypothetical protein